MPRTIFRLLPLLAFVGCDVWLDPEGPPTGAERIGTSDEPPPWEPPPDPPPGQDFLDLANVVPGLPTCGASFSSDDCYDLDLPPKPSTQRSLATHHPNFEGGGSVQTPVRSFGTTPQHEDGEQTFVPGTRSTLDGRLHLVQYSHTPKLSPIYFENLEGGMQTTAGRQVFQAGIAGTLHAFMLMGADTAYSPEELEDERIHYDHSGGTDLCNRGDASRAYPCRARELDTDPDWREGTCYDISIVSSFARGGTEPSTGIAFPGREEIRSNELTVFLENGEVVPGPDDASLPSDGLSRAVWAYPTAGVDTYGAVGSDGAVELPAWADFDAARGVMDAAAGDASHRWAKAHRMDVDHCGGWPVDPSAPAWCAYFARQARTVSPWIPSETSGASNFMPIEMSTTGDGHVLLGQDARGGGISLFYSHAASACDASGWQTIRNLPYAPYDGLVHGTYGFAEYPMIAPDGTPLGSSQTIGGAYPWIDRKGANVFLGTDVEPWGWKECSAPTGAGGDCSGVELTDLNDANAKAPKVVGLWTRGKIVHLDGVLNGVDYTAREWADRDQPMYLSLFADEDYVEVRPGNNIDFFSLENLFNHAEALTPLLPADVVWQVTAGGVGGGNPVIGEVAFDDYLTHGARIVAPMNAQLVGVPSFNVMLGNTTGPLQWKRSNGMTLNASDPGASENELYDGQSLVLQNNAPLSFDLPRLDLQGGAFIPPASTGVMGKAVFLDGINDRIEITNVAPIDAFYLGVWVELDGPDGGTLFTLSDGSRVNVTPGSVRILNNEGSAGSSACQNCTQAMWTVPDLAEGRWTHIGIAARGTKTGGTDWRLYVDGTPQLVTSWTVPLTGKLSGSFELGAASAYTDGATPITPVRAWVDELKLFEITDADFDGDHFVEMSCNRALGSMNDAGECEQIAFRTVEPVDPATHNVGSGLEFPKETYTTGSCGAEVHRNPGPDCVRDELLAIPPLDPDQPRPDQTGNLFCLSCHDSNGPVSASLADPVQRYDLSLGALAAGVVPATDDLRRQPIQWGVEHDEALWNGWRNVRLLDPGRMERCDGVDNDEDGIVDNGCDACDATGNEELGRISMWSGKVNVYRDHDGTWNPRGTTAGLSAAQGVVEGHCDDQFSDIGDPAGAVAVTATRDLKPFVSASGDLYPGRGYDEWVCCGDRAPPPAQPAVLVDVSGEVTPVWAHTDVDFVLNCSGGSLMNVGPTYVGQTTCQSGQSVTVSCDVDGVWDLLVREGTGPWQSFGSCTSSTCDGNMVVGTDDLEFSCEYCWDPFLGGPC